MYLKFVGATGPESLWEINASLRGKVSRWA